MRLSEIEQIDSVDFPKERVRDILKSAQECGSIDEYLIHRIDKDDTVGFIATSGGDVCAFVGFYKTTARAWQSSNAVTYPGHSGRKLAARIYAYVLTELKQDIQSDTVQTAASRSLWTQSLPALGFEPMIYDLHSGRIYPRDVISDDEVYSDQRYIWVISHDGFYPRQNIEESDIIMPLRGIYKVYAPVIQFR